MLLASSCSPIASYSIVLAAIMRTAIIRALINQSVTARRGTHQQQRDLGWLRCRCSVFSLKYVLQWMRLSVCELVKSQKFSSAGSTAVIKCRSACAALAIVLAARKEIILFVLIYPKLKEKRRTTLQTNSRIIDSNGSAIRDDSNNDKRRTTMKCRTIYICCLKCGEYGGGRLGSCGWQPAKQLASSPRWALGWV